MCRELKKENVTDSSATLDNGNFERFPLDQLWQNAWLKISIDSFRGKNSQH